MADWLVEHGVTLVVCAGYMHLLRPAFLERFDRIVNTHSAPLPEFPGAHPIEDVLAAGVEQRRPPSTTSTRASTRGRRSSPSQSRYGTTTRRDSARACAGSRAWAAPGAVKELIS